MSFLYICIKVSAYQQLCIVHAPRVGLPPTPGPARFLVEFSAGSRDIACGVIYSTKYLIM